MLLQQIIISEMDGIYRSDNGGQHGKYMNPEWIFLKEEMGAVEVVRETMTSLW